jgi:thioesterase DpgC
MGQEASLAPGQPASVAELLRAAGISETSLRAWQAAEPGGTADLASDRGRFSAFWQESERVAGTLPPKAKRNPAQAEAADAVRTAARASRERFLRAHVEAVYGSLTEGRSRFVPVQELVLAAADTFPGLVPTSGQLAAEDERIQGEKEGFEVDQGLFLAEVLGHEAAGRHLCHAMLLPRAETGELRAKLARDGALDLGSATLTRAGRAIVLTMHNPRFLNAEDQTTIDGMELAVDVATLDQASDIAVLRGSRLSHTKYAGRHVFGTGINLTHLYHGRIPFIWFLRRELGFVNKFYRGLASPDVLPDDVHGAGHEKPWLAVVDAFAIGGHCQYLLTMDYVLAASDAYMTLPARKEGIIPGVSNMRLPRFVGDRIARQAIQYERRIDCDTPEGRLVCDEVVPPDEMDVALSRVVERLTSSGAVSVVGNRRAFRVTQEPLDIFRSYCAVYAREQAYCHFSPALIGNLERHWNAHQRRV